MNWYVLTSPLKKEEKMADKIAGVFESKELSARFWIPSISMKKKKDGRLMMTRDMGVDDISRFQEYVELIKYVNPYIKILKTTKGRGKNSKLDYATLTNSEIKTIRRQENCSLEPMRRKYEPGMRVKITGGLFNGYVGEIREAKDETVLVDVYFVYSNIKIEASMHDIEIIRGSV